MYLKPNMLSVERTTGLFADDNHVGYNDLF